ncbi:MAG: glycosyltransferase family 2 protein [Chitinophagaceae bacterium]
MLKVSVITATYNSAATVADTVKSVKEQSYPLIEHLIIDGLSTDNTLAVIAAAGHNGPVICEKDKGIYDAMNKGIAAATGDIIAILNSDDFFANEAVVANMVALMEQEKALTAYADLWYVAAHSKEQVVRKWTSGSYVLNDFLYGWMPPHPTFFVRKEVYEQFGCFNLQLGSAADYELMLRFLYKHKVKAAYLPQVTVHMRSGGESNVSLTNRLKANKNDRKAWIINNLQPYWFTLWLKPLRKLGQFLKRS